MKEIKLTQGHVALVDDADYEWLNRYSWFAFNPHKIWYARGEVPMEGKRKKVFMHRFILGLTDRTLVVDHIDYNGLNNQRNNIRICTQSQNIQRSRRKEVTSSKYTGVGLHVKKNSYTSLKTGKVKYTEYTYWRATIRVEGKVIVLASLKDEKEAARIYNEAAIKFYGEHAKLNDI